MASLRGKSPAFGGVRMSVNVQRIALWFAILLALVWTLFPFWWALVYSVRPSELGYQTALIPFRDFHPTLDHWRWEWTYRNDVTGLAQGLRNSLAVALGTAIASVVVGLLAAFGLRSFR